MIRRAKSSDVQAIQSLIQSELNKDWSLDGLAKMIAGKHYHVVVYEKEKTMVGFAIVMIAKDSADLVSIVVSPDFRRQEIGSNLMVYLFEFIKESDIKKMILEVAVSNHSAIAFYQKHGFIQSGIRKNYYRMKGKKEDALVLFWEQKS